jgi:NAD(P)-dependent dehydrogenase (short-subunit alcohol dehydrogenase family)
MPGQALFSRNEKTATFTHNSGARHGFDLAGKAVLITGASTGISAAAAQRVRGPRQPGDHPYNASRGDEAVAADYRAAGAKAACRR